MTLGQSKNIVASYDIDSKDRKSTDYGSRAMSKTNSTRSYEDLTVDSKNGISAIDSSTVGPSKNNTMQVSLSEETTDKPLLDYPSADVIALVLILSNIPSLLLTIVHFFFSYKVYHNSDKSRLPTPLILTMDTVVILLTTLVLPSSRYFFTDMSYSIVAATFVGADFSNSLPVGIFLTLTRILSSKTSDLLELRSSSSQNTSRLPSWPGISWLSQLSAASDKYWTARYSSAELLKCALAVHICITGFLRLISSTLYAKKELSGVSQLAAPPKLRKKAPHANDHSKSANDSIWEHLLRFRAETDTKRHELTHFSSLARDGEVWLSDISSRNVTLTVSITHSSAPSVTMHVNGLLWEVKIVPAGPQNLSDETPQEIRRQWDVYVDNLSAKTEYDVVLKIGQGQSARCHYFTICTDVNEPVSVQARGESVVLTPINTDVREEQGSGLDQSNYNTGPQSPITTLEESLATANARLEEKRQTLRRTRRENTKKIQQIQKELDHIAFKVHGSGDKSEQRLQGRMLSLQTEIKRIQDHTEEMDSEKHNLIKLVASQTDIWTEEKQKRDYEANILDSKRRSYNAAKAEYEKSLGVVEAEAVRTKAKADKLSLKRTKIQQDLDRMSSEQDEILHKEYMLRSNARELVKTSRLQTEAEYLKMIHEIQQRAEYLELYGTS